MTRRKKGGARKVKRINLVLGELSGVVGDCVQFYFGLMSKDTTLKAPLISFNHGGHAGQVPASAPRCST